MYIDLFSYEGPLGVCWVCVLMSGAVFGFPYRNVPLLLKTIHNAIYLLEIPFQDVDCCIHPFDCCIDDVVPRCHWTYSCVWTHSNNIRIEYGEWIFEPWGQCCHRYPSSPASTHWDNQLDCFYLKSTTSSMRIDHKDTPKTIVEW